MVWFSDSEIFKKKESVAINKTKYPLNSGLLPEARDNY